MISSKDEHPKNAYDPIVVTESGMIISSKDEHPKNALCSILVTDSGIVIFLRDVQPPNAPNPSPPLKSPPPITFTESGIYTLVKDPQAIKES